MIGVARFEDVKTIIKMAIEADIPKEHGFSSLPKVNIAKVSEFFYDKFAEAPIFIYVENGSIVGFVGVQVESPWWSDQKVVNDYIIYVDPEYRSLKVFNALVGAMRDFAKLNKMPVISHFMSNDRTETKKVLFEKQDYQISGFIATYGI